MYTVQEESTQRSSTLKASKKKGWEILYTPAEGSDEQNTSVFVPYEDFGDKLTVIDGCAKDLEIKTDITQTVKKGESIEGNLQLKYMGDTPVALDVADIDEISFFYDKAGYIEAKWDATQQKLKVKGLKSGTVNLTIKVAMKHGSINLVNVSDKIEFTVSDTEPVIEGNLIKLTAAAGGDTIILAKPIDPNDLCDTDTDGVINVHINETETTSVNLNEIESVKLIECDSTITTLGSEFLSGADHMTEADLSGLSNITSIADNFCNACSAMYEIDINFMSAISSIGNNFVNECNYL